MKVNELIKVLKSWPDKSTEVLLSVDAEGNDYKSIDEVAESLVDDNGNILCHDVDDDESSGNRKILIIYPV